MKPYLILSFALAVSLLAVSCAPSGMTPASGSAVQEMLQGTCSLRDRGDSRLFRATIDVYERHLSGLVLIKPMGDSGAYRVLFVSELGLNLLDMEYKGGSFTVVSVQEFLNRRSLLRALQQDFHALLLDLSTVEKARWTRGKEQASAGIELRFREGRNRFVYRPADEAGSCTLRWKKGCFRGSDIRIMAEDGTRITIEHIRLKVVIEMKELIKIPDGTDG